MADIFHWPAARRVTGNAITVYPWMPESCPYKGCGKSLYGVAPHPKAAEKAGEAMRAYQCEAGHKCHVLERAINRTQEEYYASEEWQAKRASRGIENGEG